VLAAGRSPVVTQHVFLEVTGAIAMIDDGAMEMSRMIEDAMEKLHAVESDTWFGGAVGSCLGILPSPGPSAVL
jgi:hypothetical protein